MRRGIGTVAAVHLLTFHSPLMFPIPSMWSFPRGGGEVSTSSDFALLRAATVTMSYQ